MTIGVLSSTVCSHVDKSMNRNQLDTRLIDGAPEMK